MFFIGFSVSALLPLRAAELGVFNFLDWLAPTSVVFAEAADFADAGRGLVPYIGAIIFAVCEKAYISALVFSPDSDWYFSRTMASLLVLLIGLIVRNGALKATLRHLYVLKHEKAVRDVVFYEETARSVTAPLRRRHRVSGRAPAPTRSPKDWLRKSSANWRTSRPIGRRACRPA